jgi:hypothetical protein
VKIKLGYEVQTGEQVDIDLSHLIVTGITQLSGKTTTLEALIKRSGLKAIVFRTKIGEKSFTEGIEIPPFFRDRSDYEFVKSLIEAYAREKLFIEKGTLMQLCKGSGSLLEIKKKVDDALLNDKLRGLGKEIHIRLQHYLENLIPQIQYANLSKVLSINPGINIMNLERFSEEAQSLIIQSVLDEVLKNQKDIIIVIPEAWKFIPQKYNNPCKRSVESFIRQGAANNNYIWIDSQDMAGVDKIPLKQISTWILGYQTERNEVKHTLDQISLPSRLKPTEQQIMTLRKGQFFLSSYAGVAMVYVQPSWLEDGTAQRIAKGEVSVDTVKAPENLVPFIKAIPAMNGSSAILFDDSKIRKEMVELRMDFFNKIQETETFIRKLSEKVFAIESKPAINEEELTSKLLQKAQAPNVESIIQTILSRIPKHSGAITTYQVAPLEKIKKDFQEDARKFILREVGKLDDEQRRILRFVESQGKGCSLTMIIDKCLYLSATSGGTRDRVSKKIADIVALQLARKDKNAVVYPNLREFIKAYTGVHEVTDPEMQLIYDHIIAGLIGQGGGS